MSIQAIANFIEFQSVDGRSELRYQNGNVGGVLVVDGLAYSYLSFLYQGASKNRTGDNISSSLTIAQNAISMNIAQQAVNNFWSVRVDTLAVNPDTLAVGRLLSREYWITTTLTYDTTAVVIELSSGIDAVGADAPSRSLTRDLVGALPLSASIRNG
jgi:hypothetical protein